MRREGLRALAATAGLALACFGCAMRSPVLLYRGTEALASTTVLKDVDDKTGQPIQRAQEAARTTIIPIYKSDYVPPDKPLIDVKAGVRVLASRDKALTSIKTWQAFGIYTISAGFPKRDEMEFFRDSICRDLFDTCTFRYTYPAPFEDAAVDLIVEVTATDVEMSNNKTYSVIIGNVPYVNIVTLFGVPQEYFHARLGLKFDVKTPDGAVVKSYTTTHEGREGVSLYRMPWANYIWYRSVFRRVFLSAMDDFRKKLVEDKALLLQRAGKAAAAP